MTLISPFLALCEMISLLIYSWGQEVVFDIPYLAHTFGSTPTASRIKIGVLGL